MAKQKIIDDMKQLSISQFITILKDTKERHGDLKLSVAIDEEGNGFSPLTFRGLGIDPELKELTIYPLLVTPTC